MRGEKAPRKSNVAQVGRSRDKQSCLRIVFLVCGSMLSHVEFWELQFDHSGAMRSDLRCPGVCLRHPGGALGLAMGSGYRLRCSACSWRYVVVTLKPHRRPVQSVPGNDNLVVVFDVLGCRGGQRRHQWHRTVWMTTVAATH